MSIANIQRLINALTPLPEERVQAIYRGDIQPLPFDYQRAQLAA